VAGGVVAVAALAELRARRSTWERVSSAPLFADDESGPMVSPAQVVSRLVFRDGPGSAIEE
jgi:hypothetical protein